MLEVHLQSFQNLLIEKACLNNLGLAESICSNLSVHKEQEIAVQTVVTNISMYTTILNTIPGIIFSLFFGPWSDTNGRKLLMILPLFGFILSYAIMILMTYFTYVYA